ncbi:MAG: hypothetical protein RLY14_1442 [Planctomycetota bacterium]|jgi:hypothetical protein
MSRGCATDLREPSSAKQLYEKRPQANERTENLFRHQVHNLRTGTSNHMSGDQLAQSFNA